MLCVCIDSGTSLCSACSNITSACYGQTWSVYLFHYPYRSFLIVHEHLHTSTKLTLQSCFCNISYCASLFVFQFPYPPSTSVFALNCSFSLTLSLTHTLTHLVSYSLSLSLYLWAGSLSKPSQPLPYYQSAAHLGAWVHLLCLLIPLINCLAWSCRACLLIEWFIWF